MSDVREMIETINRAVAEDALHLTEWESEFIESIGRQVQAGRGLTDRQDAVLEKIWRKATT
jgi:hypothetical protein